ncbi:MAG: hypothetical protein IJT51_03335, partial [Bacteroidales bacterium]|nr:hypothetical protein [Bacteroidales bacterium]
MKQFYQRILLFSAVILLSLFKLMAQTVTNSYSYVWHYDSVYSQSYGVSTNYSSSGSYTFNASAGMYKLEVWGAQGGSGKCGSSNNTPGGKGGYSVGTITLNTTTTFYIYVGGKGSYSAGTKLYAGGFNGGGQGASQNSSTYGGSGGGGTDIRIASTSLYARVIIAGGGGGYADEGETTGRVPGVGGGTSGGDGLNPQGSVPGTAKGGSQLSGGAAGAQWSGQGVVATAGSFGQGGNISSNSSGGGAGGGGGWYGGGAEAWGCAAGGSGYVYTSSTASNYPSGCLLNSSYYLTSANTYAGNMTFASTTGSTETGHDENGYARITPLVTILEHIDSTISHTIVTTTIHDTMCSNYTYSSFNFNFKGDTMAVGNHTYTRNIYISSAKDSIVILNIYVEPNLADVNYQDSVCYGTQSYFNHGFMINIKDSLPGAYTYTRSEAIGHCTQNHTLTLKLKSQRYVHYYDSICQGQNYYDVHNYGFERITQNYPAGDYDFKRNEYNNGCFDSVILHLHIRAIDTIKHTQYICANSSYSGYGFVNLSDTGVYIGTIPSANGCGDVVILTLKHNPVYNIVIRDTIRHGVIYTQHDYVVRTMDSTAGTYNYVKNLHTVSGCDSVVTLELCIL